MYKQWFIIGVISFLLLYGLGEIEKINMTKEEKFSQVFIDNLLTVSDI